MKIGIPRERKENERRVAITPLGVKELSQLGAEIFIENDAGILSGFTNDEYLDAGAKIANTLEEVWAQDLVVKVKEPHVDEVPYFRPGLNVFSFLHLAVFPELTQALLDKEVTGIDYDLVMLDDGRLPILEPMSVIAGKLSVQCGAYALQSKVNGRGVLLGGAPGVPPSKVVVLGAGASGRNAAQIAIGMGAQLTILDINTRRLEEFASIAGSIRTRYSTPVAVEEEIADADLVIGAVLIPGAKAPTLISKEMLKIMPEKSVIVDISIDQGGIAETSRATTIADPTYVESGVVHYCVANMPALVPRTSTIALTNATLPWMKMFVKKGIEGSIKDSAPVKRSITSYKGSLTNKEIGEAHGISHVEMDELV